jgi:hypothetical protein
MNEDTTGNDVEPMAIRIRTRITEAATAVLTVTRNTAIIKESGMKAGKCTLIDFATRRGMKSHLIVRLIVGAFENIDFSLIGPVWTDRPIGRPDTAAVGHRKKISDEETTVIGLLGADSDADRVFQQREYGNCPSTHDLRF